MRPDPPKVLFALAGTLGMQVLPQVATPFGQQSVGLAATLSVILAQEWDRAASRLIEENAAVSELLSRARAVVNDAGVKGRLDVAVSRPPTTDYRVSALQAQNDDLRRLLIEVHALVDSMAGEAAAQFSEAIWDELKESTRRRHLMTTT
jgi:hypothetical protein